MGVAAYCRGNMAISAQYCRDGGCSGCFRCRPTKPTPRPAGWGSKAQARADRAAAGLLRFCLDRDGSPPTVATLADMVHEVTGVGRQTAMDAAGRALEP